MFNLRSKGFEVPFGNRSTDLPSENQSKCQFPPYPAASLSSLLLSAGHGYGGAAAEVLALDLCANGLEDYSVLTLGMPVPIQEAFQEDTNSIISKLAHHG